MATPTASGRRLCHREAKDLAERAMVASATAELVAGVGISTAPSTFPRMSLAMMLVTTGTDVDADCQIRLVVDLERNSRTPDCSGCRQVRAFAQDPEVQQARDLPVHGGDAQP